MQLKQLSSFPLRFLQFIFCVRKLWLPFHPAGVRILKPVLA